MPEVRPVRDSPEPDVTMDVAFPHQGSPTIYKMECYSSGITDPEQRSDVVLTNSAIHEVRSTKQTSCTERRDCAGRVGREQCRVFSKRGQGTPRSEEHTSELQSQSNLV